MIEHYGTVDSHDSSNHSFFHLSFATLCREQSGFNSEELGPTRKRPGTPIATTAAVHAASFCCCFYLSLARMPGGCRFKIGWSRSPGFCSLSARVERGLLAFWLWPRERGRDDTGITDCNLAA